MVSLKKQLSAAILIAIVALAVRLPGIGETMTVDEFNWMERSQIFWHKIFRNGDLSGTFLSSHPGATVMWLAGAGIAWQEAQLGFDMEQSNLRHFRKYVTAPMAVATAVLIGIITVLCIPLFGIGGGALAGLFLALDPYILGMNRVVHPDAILGLFMLTAILAALNYRSSSQRRYLVIAGIATGMAFVTKLLPALWLGPIGLLLAFVPATFQIRDIKWKHGMKVVASVFAIAIITSFIVWPAPLTKSDFLIGHIVGDASKVAQVEHVALEATDSDEDTINPLSFYVRTVAARVPLHMQLLVLAGLIAAVVGSKRDVKGSQHSTILWLAFYAVGFFFLVTLVAKKGDRYAVPLLVTLPVIASWGAIMFWDMLGRLRQSTYWKAGLAGLAGLAVATSLWQTAPYAIAYNNPLFPNVRPLSQQGWGEGLEEAAAWINQHEGSDEFFIASWYPSVTRTYAAGRTLGLSSREDSRVRYVVTYRNMGGRAQDTQASDVLDEFRDQTPVHTVLVNNTPYVFVYEREVYEHIVGELVPGITVGQDIVLNTPLRGIELLIATYSGRADTGELQVVIRDAESGIVRDRLSIPVADLVDDEWVQLATNQPVGEAGETVRIEVLALGTREGNAPTVRYSRAFDYRPGNFMRSHNRPVSSDDTKTGDLGLRVLSPSTE